MNKYERDVQGYTQAAGKQALKAMLFFFGVVPASLFAAALTLTYGLKFLLPACLVLLAGALIAKKLKGASL